MFDVSIQKELKKKVESIPDLKVKGYTFSENCFINFITDRKVFVTGVIKALQGIDGFTGLKSREDGTEIIFKV